MEIENIIMGIISYSGDAKRLAFEALKLAKENEFVKSNELMNEARKQENEAHKFQTKLLVEEANGVKVELNVLLIHAQDHLMTSIAVIDLIEEMIEIYKR